MLRLRKNAAGLLHRNPHTTLITPEAPVAASTHGGRAKCLQRLVRLNLPVPPTVALSFEAVKRLAAGQMPDISAVVDQFAPDALLCVRPSSEDPDWGGPGAVLNIGMNDARYKDLSRTLGKEAAAALYLRFVQSYAINVARLDADIFDGVSDGGAKGVAETLHAYEDEADESFPQDPRDQIAGVLVSMARAWEGTSARLLRQAKGAPADAGLGLVVQQMIPGFGQGECGSGVLQLVNPDTGKKQVTGRYLSQSQGREALGAAAALYLQKDERGESLEDVAPDAFAALQDHAALMRARLREELQVEFVIQNGDVHILDGVRVPRSARAAVRIAVALAEDGIISREEALMRIDPHTLTRLLHKQVDPMAVRDLLARGVAASPGAATGRLVFTAHEAQAAAARGEGAVLVRRETTPEDVRGMHAAVAVLTEKGGMTSHAAVIGRGLGLPCIVGASALRFQTRREQIVAPDGRVFKAGETVTIDGTLGEVLAGSPALTEGTLDEAFQTLMSWADAARDIGIRANADTPSDAQTSRRFDAQGIGLCRTEHMFFEAGRLTVMREAILAETSGARQAALERLLPMQREDFIQLFRIMEGRPVCIRLLDPPLHE
jgi:pyruvate,orthophosphate dikinase